MAVYTQNVILLGDIMIDHTIHGKSTKLANEAPVPVIISTTEKYSLGGSGNVLANLVALSSNVFIFGRVGTDWNNQMKNILPNCINHMSVDPDYKTIIKHRIYCDHKLMCRYDEEEYKTVSHDEENHIVEQIATIIKTHIIMSVVFSDYNKGFLTESLCQRVISLCNKHNVCTVVDPKDSYKKYIGCTIIKPNRQELKNIFNIDYHKSTLIHAHQQLQDLMKCKLSIITLSEDGISAYKDGMIYSYHEEVKEVIDVTGAGDIVCSVIGAYHKIDVPILLRYASYYASLSISHLGTYTITSEDMNKLYLNYSSLQTIIPTPNTIVFTNGCFDILHSAHIDLFAFCRSLGSIVIVGINSDASIKRLKGVSRPINCLKDRIKILKAISYIDFVIPFEEDTPLQLIKSIHPYYIIKGGDYKKEEVIGKEYAKEVVIFDYIHGKSTTNIIKTINNNLK
jgi:D-beta-D-heptose 7-phosphate kinase/D-beta-D-heptose 1-phosphate adenosyltransferase